MTPNYIHSKPSDYNFCNEFSESNLITETKCLCVYQYEPSFELEENRHTMLCEFYFLSMETKTFMKIYKYHNGQIEDSLFYEYKDKLVRFLELYVYYQQHFETRFSFDASCLNDYEIDDPLERIINVLHDFKIFSCFVLAQFIQIFLIFYFELSDLINVCTLCMTNSISAFTISTSCQMFFISNRSIFQFPFCRFL